MCNQASQGNGPDVAMGPNENYASPATTAFRDKSNELMQAEELEQRAKLLRRYDELNKKYPELCEFVELIQFVRRIRF